MSPRPGTIALASLALLGAGGSCSPSEEVPRPPLVLISLDTLRADHLVPYGYTRRTSPNLARFAAEAVRFDAAQTQSTATLPSHLSLLTSLFPPQIGITRDDGTNVTQGKTRLRLPEAAETLAEVLVAHGYRTAAFTDGGFVHEAYGLGQGFERFERNTVEEGAYRSGLPMTVERAARWLDEADGRPPFLFVHTYDVHEPYDPPPPFSRAFTDVDYATFQRETGVEARPFLLEARIDELSRKDVKRVRGLYDNGILAADRALGELFDALRERGLYERAVIVVLSDHGEEFLDHGGFGHGPSVYQELARVPLLVRLPGGRGGGRVVTGPVGLVDVAPTLLELAGVAVPPAFAGRGLGAVLSGEDAGAWLAERPLFVDVPDRRRHVVGWRRGPWKLVRRRDGRRELYHLGRDPDETEDLAAAQPARVAELEAGLERWLAEVRDEARARGTLAVEQAGGGSPDNADRLRALGYAR